MRQYIDPRFQYGYPPAYYAQRERPRARAKQLIGRVNLSGVPLMGMLGMEYVTSVIVIAVAAIVELLPAAMETLGFDPGAAREAQHFLHSGTDVQTALSIVMYLLMFLVPFCLFAHFNRMSVKNIFREERPPFGTTVFTVCAALGLSIAAAYIAYAMEFVFQLFGVSGMPVETAAPENMTGFILQFVQICVLPPIVEEFCFRGVLFKHISDTAGYKFAIFATAALFAIAHASPLTLPLAFLFGILAAFVRAKSGSLWPCVFAHFAVNLTAYLSSIGIEYLPEDVMAFWDGIYSGAYLILGGLAFLIFFKINRFDPEKIFHIKGEDRDIRSGNIKYYFASVTLWAFFLIEALATVGVLLI